MTDVVEIVPVSFKTGRAHAPRLSEPYVPGRRHRRFWTESELEVIREWYPKGGAEACAARLPQHHTGKIGIYQQAAKLGLYAPRGRGGGTRESINPPADIDDILRREYALQDGKKRGAVNAIADRLGLPRWWVTKRASGLGLVMPHKKEPPWTAAETALMSKVPLHDPARCARIFREHGFARSPTAIVIRAKRLGISRRFAEGLSAQQAAAIVGFDSKTMCVYLIAGDCRATKRDDRRSPQQGGSRWVITPADLRSFVLNHLDRIDLRKVDKFAFVHLVAGDVAAGGPTGTAEPAVRRPPCRTPRTARLTASERTMVRAFAALGYDAQRVLRHLPGRTEADIASEIAAAPCPNPRKDITMNATARGEA